MVAFSSDVCCACSEETRRGRRDTKLNQRNLRALRGEINVGVTPLPILKTLACLWNLTMPWWWIIELVYLIRKKYKYKYKYIASAIMRGKSVGHFDEMAPFCIVDKSTPSSFVPQPTHPHPPPPPPPPQTNVVWLKTSSLPSTTNNIGSGGGGDLRHLDRIIQSCMITVNEIVSDKSPRFRKV